MEGRKDLFYHLFIDVIFEGRYQSHYSLFTVAIFELVVDHRVVSLDDDEVKRRDDVIDKAAPKKLFREDWHHLIYQDVLLAVSG